ncbi:MAG: glycosyltransferase [Thiotrichaceae bacterium]
MKKINILHLTTAFVVGGAEKVVLDLLKNLDKQRFNASIIALSHNADMLPEYLESGIKAEKLDMKKGFPGMVKVLKYLDHYIAENNIDIIHAHLFHPLPIASLLKLKHPKLKIVFTSHSINIGGKAREKLTWLLKGLRNTDIVFSESMKTNMYKEDCIVIPNGVDLNKFTAEMPKHDKFTFIAVGSIRPEKNHKFLVGCAKNLKEKGLDFELQIVGGGDENQVLIDEIQAEIKQLDVEDCVKMLGSRNDIPELLMKAHCNLLPSLFEGMPIALLEAGAARLPVITTPVGSIPTLVDESNGYLSSLDDFCATMEKVYSHYEDAKVKGIALADKINKSYSINSMAEVHGKLYASLLER